MNAPEVQADPRLAEVPGDQSIRVSFYMFFSGGGIGRYTHELAGTLNQVPGVDVEVVCSPDYQWKDSSSYASWTGLKRIAHPVPVIRRAKFLHGQFVNPVRFVGRAVGQRADILHFCNINHLSYPFWRNRLDKTDLGVAITAHDVKRRRGIINRRWEESALRAFYQRADALFVHSEFQSDELVEFAEVRRDAIHVVPHGPYAYGDPTADKASLRRRFHLPVDAEIALFFGQIRDDKNLDVLIRSLAICRADPHLVIAGKSASQNRPISEYQKLVEELGLEARVTFIPRFIQDEEIGDLFTMADWVALPYRETFTSQSGVLNVAAHYERPVLVGPSPVLKETLEHTDIGVVCKGDHTALIAEGVDVLSDRINRGHPHQFETYRRAFSWQQNATETLRVYRHILSSRPCPSSSTK